MELLCSRLPSSFFWNVESEAQTAAAAQPTPSRKYSPRSCQPAQPHAAAAAALLPNQAQLGWRVSLLLATTACVYERERHRENIKAQRKGARIIPHKILISGLFAEGIKDI